MTVLAVAAAATTVIAACLNEGALPAAVVCLSAIAVGLAWPRVALRPVSSELSFPLRACREGEQAVAVMRIGNAAPWKSWGLCLEPEVNCEPNVLALAPVGGFSQTAFRCELTPVRRGIVPVREPRLSTGFPFGLERRSKSVVVNNEMTVTPRTWPIIGLPQPRRRPSQQELSASSRPGSSGTTLGLRPYRRGDSRRDVHWRQTARRDVLVVREREASEAVRLQLWLDASRISLGFEDPESCLDWSTRFAASVLEQFSDSATTVGLGTCNGGRPELKLGEAAYAALAAMEVDERRVDRLLCLASAKIDRATEPWFITTPAGFRTLQAANFLAPGRRFFILDVDGEVNERSLDESAADVWIVSLPDGSTRSRFAKEGAFRVRDCR